jgi:ribosomal protein L11 methyltransferase
MSDKWLEIACDIPVEYADILSAYLTELSGNGVCTENLNVDAFSHSEIVHSPVVSIKAYFNSADSINDRMADIKAFLQQLAAGNPDLTISEPVLSEVRSEDWSTSWKENFKPLRVGKRLLIVPSWEEAHDLPDDIVLHLDPGMAFGTGGHETTRLCLELIEQIMTDAPADGQLSVLDLGTGSGILAMAAVKLGAGTVHAVDIDPLAIEVAKENLMINNIADRVECNTTPIESISDIYDVILANILAEELVRLAPQIISRLKAGGRLVLSGILAEKEAFVREGFSHFPVEYIETRRDGEWIALLYKTGEAK